MISKISTIKYFIFPYYRQFALLVFLSLITSGFATITIALLYPIVSLSLDVSISDNLIFQILYSIADYLPISDQIIANTMLFLTFTIFTFILEIIYANYSAKITSEIVIKNKLSLFDKYITNNYQFYVNNRQGELLYKIHNAPANLAMLIDIFTRLIADILLSLSIFALLLSLSVHGTLLAILIIMAYYAFTKFLSAKISYITGTGRFESAQRESVTLNEYITGIRQIKVFQVGEHWKSKYNEAVTTFWTLYRRDSFWIKTQSSALFCTVFLTIGGVLILLRVIYPVNFITIIPIFASFVFAGFKLLPKLSNFGTYRMSIMNALPNLEGIHEILTDDTYTPKKIDSVEFLNLNKIEFKNVTFTHKNRESTLKNISLTIKKGKITALVGESGSGKSTIIDLLLGLYTAHGIKIDGTNLEVCLSSFLKKVGYVSQETFIFNGTIRDNIMFGVEHSEESLTEAVKLSNSEFIYEMPDQLDTIVGDHGIKLSGGQKQRIAIARAMIKKPEILILDESTSSLDAISENVVQEAINKISRQCTTLIIAHRLSTIKSADVIYVVDNGKIVEYGNHEVLMSGRGKYRELYGK